MKEDTKNKEIVINYGTVSKKVLRIYLIVLTIILIYIILPNYEISTSNVITSLIIIAIFLVLYFIRFIVDYTHMKLLTPDYTDPVSIKKALDYLYKLQIRAEKVNNRKNSSVDKYIEFCQAYKYLLEYIKRVK